MNQGTSYAALTPAMDVLGCWCIGRTVVFIPNAIPAADTYLNSC